MPVLFFTVCIPSLLAPSKGIHFDNVGLKIKPGILGSQEQQIHRSSHIDLQNHVKSCDFSFVSDVNMNVLVSRVTTP